MRWRPDSSQVWRVRVALWRGSGAWRRDCLGGESSSARARCRRCGGQGALWPIGFTALWFLHIATSGARAVASERREMPGPDMTRRRTVGVFASAVALAILASAVAAPRAWAFTESRVIQ